MIRTDAAIGEMKPEYQTAYSLMHGKPRQLCGGSILDKFTVRLYARAFRDSDEIYTSSACRYGNGRRKSGRRRLLSIVIMHITGQDFRHTTLYAIDQADYFVNFAVPKFV